MGCRYMIVFLTKRLSPSDKIQAKVERQGRFGYRATEPVCGGENPIMPYMNGPCRHFFAYMKWMVDFFYGIWTCR